MSNLKDTFSSIFGLLGAIGGAIILIGQSGVVLPLWLNTAGIILPIISIAVIGWLTGKAPNGSVKSDALVKETNAK